MNVSIKKHIFVGMSGGIDSSATVKLLVDQGYKVTGITFVGLGKEQTSLQTGKTAFIGKSSSRKCCSVDEVLIAKQVCFSLGINHITLDLSDIFKEQVQDYFVNSYVNGETPNPCMLCNRFVKIGALVDYARKNGADCVAMGHYSGLDLVDGEYLLKAGKDKNKDQSYFLALLKAEILPYLLFPLANKEKNEVKHIIDSSDLPIKSNKSESQDVCFIDNDYRDYLRHKGIKSNSGIFLYKDKPIGEHNGTAFYALGQRRGLGVTVGQKIFVRELNIKNNTIVLGEKPKSSTFIIKNLNIFSSKFQDGEWNIQIRYRAPQIKGTIKFIDSDTVQVILSQAQELVTPGQYAVFYKNDYIYGAGKITTIQLLEE